MNVVPTPLPNSWQRMALGDLVTIVGRQVDPSQEPEQEFSYISLENIKAGAGRIIEFAPTLGQEIGSAKTTFQKGDILYGRLRPYLQKVVIAPFDGVAATELLPLKPRGPIYPEFLRDFLLGPEHLADVTRLMSGARMPRVRTEELLRLSVPVPPIADQRRIVRALAFFRYKVASTREKIERALALGRSYEQTILSKAYRGDLSALWREHLDADQDGEALLAEVLRDRRAEWEAAEMSRLATEGHPLLNGKLKKRYSEPNPVNPEGLTALPPGWVWASLSQLSSAVDPICYGVVETGDEVEDGVALIRTQDIKDGTVEVDRMRRVSRQIDETYARSRVRGGEVLVSLVGSIGRIAIVPNCLEGANINRALARVTPAPSISSTWLFYALETSHLQNWMAHGARGVARKILNLSLLAQVPIPLPPIKERDWLLRMLETRRLNLRVIQQRLAETLTTLAKLATNVQANALSGQLTLADPGDQAAAAGSYERLDISQRRQSPRKGKRNTMNRTRFKSSNRQTQKRELTTVLSEHPAGLDPLRLMEAAGYALKEVESFYKDLAKNIDLQSIKEERPDSASVLLLVN